MTRGSEESPSTGMSRDQHGRGPGSGRGGPNDPNYGGGPNGPGGFGNHARQLTHQQRYELYGKIIKVFEFSNNKLSALNTMKSRGNLMAPGPMPGQAMPNSPGIVSIIRFWNLRLGFISHESSHSG